MTRTGLALGERYRLDKRIAAGGVGQVWLASDLLLSRPVAVKVLRPEYADHPETLDRFRKEARHAGSLSHPHVAQVYDYGPAGPDWPPFLVMEFVDGPSLADILVVDPVEPAFALDVVAQAADGLSAAHRAGLVHRDVKPGNLLIGPDRLVKVTDFGIAHAAGQAPITGPNLVMGTTQYMAPERISGGPATPASDLYALGIVLHECLTGLPPYEGPPSEVMAAHLYLPLPPLPAGVPAELDDLVARLTAKDPAARISDARELAAIAAGLRDAVLAGLVSTAQTASMSGTAPDARPATAFPAGWPACDSTRPGRTGLGQAAFAGDWPAGPGDAVPGAGPARPAEIPDEWAVPALMSPGGPPGPPAGGPRPDRGRRPRLLVLVAAIAAGVVLVGLLVAGALRSAPAGNGAPATSSSGAARPARPSPRGLSRVSAPAATPGATAPAVAPAPASPRAGVAKSPRPPARPTGSGSPSPSSSQGGPGSASGRPSGSPSGSASAGPSGSASPIPSAPSSAAPGPVCVGTICL